MIQIVKPYTLMFDEEPHEYWLNGFRVPSVTQVLAARKLYKGDEWWKEEHRVRGIAVHVATQLEDEDDLDETTLAPELAGYLDAWRKFKAERRYAIELIEERLASVSLGYAGTIDRWGRLDGKTALVDIKTGGWQAAYALQIAAYRAMLAEHGVMSEIAVCVTLQADGSYHLRHLNTIDLYRAEALWRNALALTQWHLAA